MEGSVAAVELGTVHVEAPDWGKSEVDMFLESSFGHAYNPYSKNLGIGIGMINEDG